jgi:hypothetical protein
MELVECLSTNQFERQKCAKAILEFENCQKLNANYRQKLASLRYHIARLQKKLEQARLKPH